MKPTPEKKRIFLVEDHRMFREGLKLFIAQEPDMEVCGEADNAADALVAIDTALPDAVISDVSMPGMNGIEFLKNMKARHPDIAAVVLSMHDDSVYAERALRAGALGYVMKRESTEEVITAVRKAMQGEFHVSGKVTGAIFHKAFNTATTGRNEPSPVDLLSDRELEVFEMLGRGKNTREIAEMLNLSPKTVESHRAHIKEKLRITTATELIRHATLWVEHESAGT